MEYYSALVANEAHISDCYNVPGVTCSTEGFSPEAATNSLDLFSRTREVPGESSLLAYYSECNRVHVPHVKEPKNLREALNGPDSDHWRGALRREGASISEHDVLTRVEVEDLPADAHVLDIMWVFTFKAHEVGERQYKARLVVRGDRQRPEDYSEVTSPTTRLETIRSMYAVATATGSIIRTGHVSTVFLNAVLPEKHLYIKMPAWVIGDGGNEIVHYHVVRALYGLKQAPGCWYGEVEKRMLKLGFHASKVDACCCV